MNKDMLFLSLQILKQIKEVKNFDKLKNDIIEGVDTRAGDKVSSGLIFEGSHYF